MTQTAQARSEAAQPTALQVVLDLMVPWLRDLTAGDPVKAHIAEYFTGELQRHMREDAAARTRAAVSSLAITDDAATILALFAGTPELLRIEQIRQRLDGATRLLCPPDPNMDQGRFGVAKLMQEIIAEAVALRQEVTAVPAAGR